MEKIKIAPSFTSHWSVQKLTELYERTSICDKIAELASPCSDNPLKIDCYYENGYQALGAIVATRCIVSERDYLAYEGFLKRVAADAYRANYEGIWKLVQETLELKPFSLYSILGKIYSNMSENDFWGNFVSFIKGALRNVQWKPMYNFRARRSKRPQRKRGYDDKGSLRLPHEKHLPETLGEIMDQLLSRQDRRDNILQPKSYNLYDTKRWNRCGIGLLNSQLLKYNWKGELRDGSEEDQESRNRKKKSRNKSSRGARKNQLPE